MVGELVPESCWALAYISRFDRQGIAVRVGHHCAEPIRRRYDLEAAVRPFLAMYNTRVEVDQFVAALHQIAVAAPG